RLAREPAETAALAFSPDGRFLVTGGKDHDAHVWDLVTGKEAAALAGHEGPVTFTAFAAGGGLVTASTDTTALVWDFAARTRDVRPRPERVAQGDVEGLWADLGGDDAAKAYRAVVRLAAAPDLALPLLEQRLPRGAPAAD